MKTLNSIAVIFFYAISSYSQTSVLWQHCYGSPASAATDNGYRVKATEDGGFIVVGDAGYSGGNIVGYHLSGSGSPEDAWVIKTDANGSIQWTGCLGGIYDDLAFDVKQTYDGGYIVVGYAKSEDGDVTGHHGAAGTKDMWVVKLSVGGTIEWQKSFGGSGDDLGNSIIQLPDSSYIAAGSTTSNDGDVSVVLGSPGYTDLWVIKLSKTGNLIWEKSYGGTGDETATQVEQHADGTLLVGGYSSSVNGDLTANNGWYDAWVLRIDTSGTLLDQKSFGGPGYDYSPEHFGRSSFTLTDNGELIFSSLINGSGPDVAGGDVSAVIPNSVLNGDIWIVRLDYGLNIVWENTLGTTYEDAPSETIRLLNGNYAVIGYSNNNLPPLGGYNFFLLVFDSSGNERYTKTFGGPGNDKGYSIIQLPDGDFVVTGYVSQNGSDVDGVHLGFNQNVADDLWLAKLGCNLDVSVTINGNQITSNAIGVNYQWLDCDYGNTPILNATSQSYTGTSNGTYSVQISQNGCVATSGCNSLTTVGIIENNFSKLELYPNPVSASGNLFIYSNDLKPVKVEIYSLQGRLVYHNTHQPQTQFTIPNLAAGSYAYRLITDAFIKNGIVVVR